MSEYGPPLPTGYDRTKRVLTDRSDCVVTVGFDSTQTVLPRFLVRLHYVSGRGPVEWTVIARMDHNEVSPTGHDVYDEGLHVDIDRRTSREVTREPTHPPLPVSRGRVLRACVNYLNEHTDWFVDVYEERKGPDNPPHWSADGGSARTFFLVDDEERGVSEQNPVAEAITPAELSEVIAEETGETAEEIEQGAAEIDIEPPWEADSAEE